MPPQEAEAFHAALAPYYARSRERHACVAFPASGHFMREEDWAVLWENALAWFERFLT